MSETRIYLLDCSEKFDFREHEKLGLYEKIMEEAERQGNVYSVEGFVEAWNNEELNYTNTFIHIQEV